MVRVVRDTEGVRIMKYLIIILSIAVLSGCNAKRWCYNRYPPVEQTDTLMIIDTVKIDVPVAVPMPKDTVRLVDTIYIESALETFVDTLKTVYAESLCGWVEGIMLHELYHRDAIIRDTVTVYLPSETTIITVDKIHEVPYVTPWHNFTVRFFWVAIAFGLVYILLRVLRR